MQGLLNVAPIETTPSTKDGKSSDLASSLGVRHLARVLDARLKYAFRPTLCFLHFAHGNFEVASEAVDRGGIDGRWIARESIIHVAQRPISRLSDLLSASGFRVLREADGHCGIELEEGVEVKRCRVELGRRCGEVSSNIKRRSPSMPMGARVTAPGSAGSGAPAGLGPTGDEMEVSVPFAGADAVVGPALLAVGLAGAAAASLADATAPGAAPGAASTWA